MPKAAQTQMISDSFSEMKEIWEYSHDDTIIGNINALLAFLSKNNTDIINRDFSLQLPVEIIPYQCSFFHFLLYYSPYPHYAFVVNIAETLFFGAFTGRKYDHIMLTCPCVTQSNTILKSLQMLLTHPVFSTLLKQQKIKTILLRDVSDELINVLRNQINEYSFHLHSLKELHYAAYDLKKTLDLKGSSFANVRWHLNKFSKANHTIEEVTSKKDLRSAVHLIGQWRRHAIKKRGFSFADMRSDKLGVNIVAELTQKKQEISPNSFDIRASDISARMLKIDGAVAAINIGFPLGISEKQPVFAHAIGITDLSVPHLAEFAQYDFWAYIYKQGYRFVNDGPSWRRSLEVFKNKFRPFAKKRYYWVTLSLE